MELEKKARGSAFELILSICTGARKYPVITAEDEGYNDALGDIFDYIIKNESSCLMPGTKEQGEWKRDHIVLRKRKDWNDEEYLCEITDKLDTVTSSYTNKEIGFGHYLLDCGYENNLHWYGIRVPGRTVGDIAVDSNGKIVKIEIGQDSIYLTNKYPHNINEQLKQYIGVKIKAIK